MTGLSLSPRADLFRFTFPKNFLPEEVEEKYGELLNRNKSVISKPIDYLNESIQGITLPGISDLVVEQNQTSANSINTSLGKLNREPVHQNHYVSPGNPLSKINKTFTITFRKNQGLLNYFMLYETIFYKTLKEYAKRDGDDVLFLEILDETGRIIMRILFKQPIINGLDGLTFSWNTQERQVETFDMEFSFNDIDIDFVIN